MDSFNKGVLCAAGILVRLFDQPMMAAAIINECGLNNSDCSSMDQYDRNNLKLLKNERGMNLKGL